jgi:FkbM family methyltransferase
MEPICYRRDSKMKFYVEAGANDGIQQSRSLHLKDDLAYHGIMIEPNPVAFNKCCKNRDSINHTFINAALVPFDYEYDEISLYGRAGSMDPRSLHQSLMGCVSDSNWIKNEPERFTQEPIYNVKARTLQSILDELKVKELEYLFLDVEGYEASVLKGVSKDTIINNCEVELHDPANHEEEKKQIVTICEEFNLINSETIKNDGNYKLVFNK